MKVNATLAPTRDSKNSPRDQADLFCAENGAMTIKNTTKQ